MADDFVQVPPDSAGGKRVDTSDLTVNSVLVQLQRIVIADPVNPAGFTTIMAAVAGAALVTQNHAS